MTSVEWGDKCSTMVTLETESMADCVPSLVSNRVNMAPRGFSWTRIQQAGSLIHLSFDHWPRFRRRARCTSRAGPTLQLGDLVLQLLLPRSRWCGRRCRCSRRTWWSAIRRSQFSKLRQSSPIRSSWWSGSKLFSAKSKILCKTYIRMFKSYMKNVEIYNSFVIL